MSKLYAFCNVPIYDMETRELVFENLELDLKNFLNSVTDDDITVLASTLWEVHSPNTLTFTNNFFKTISNKFDIQYHLLYNTAVDQLDSNWDNENSTSYLFFLNKLTHAKKFFQQPFNAKWNHTKFRFLFLTGKLTKRNRILPLLKFQESNLLNKDNCIWSSHYNPTLVKSVYDVVKDSYGKRYIKDFLKRYHNNPDNIKLLNLNSTTHYDGIPFDHTLYEQTSFSVISESELSQSLPVWITEKTWRAILNRHPFMFVGQPHTLKFLRSIGFKTFNEYLPYDYDCIEDFDDRLDLVLKNLSWLKRNWNKLDFESINRDIEHNYKMAIIKSTTDINNLHQNINFSYGDRKVNIGLYNNGNDQIHTVDPSVDHLCYYNWSNYTTNFFWENT